MPNNTRRDGEQAREAILVAAERYARLRPDALVIVACGEVEIVREAAGAAPPEGASDYDAVILAALNDNALSSKRVARARPSLQQMVPRATRQSG